MSMDLWKLIAQVSERYGRRLEQHKATHPSGKELNELTGQQFQYLQAIRGNPQQATVSSLSKHFGVRPPTVTALVARLDEKGLVKRSPHETDGRSHYLALTQKAHRLLEVQEMAFKALSEDIEASLTPEDLKAYMKLTEKVCLAFEKQEKTKEKELEP